ncbi:MAG: hypothetical protein LBG81_09175 [Coriobacteriaceae bacterium]|jgi:hypothetical protein|nr:hypothetical protein [Coriobacteriaceae bacterium]
MAVFRIEKTQNYTVMSNHHIRNQTLTLKAKGLYQKIIVIGNQVQFDKLRHTLDEVLNELRRIEHVEDVDVETLALIRTAAEIINGFK